MSWPTRSCTGSRRDLGSVDSWVGVDPGTVRDPRAYLVRITTRQALTHLRALGRRKESSPGPWLPEPLLTALDVVLLTDGGGVVRAALTPVVGADEVARVLGRIGAAAVLRPAGSNGDPALIVHLDGEVDTVLAMRVDDGLVTGPYAVRNPEKLSYLDGETALSR
ncbi:hypothetical protein ACH4ZU_29045 [Streptomyces sp. NPDC020472]|uniref:hypothetical protein n=1 Tax=Streptomyces sp. NPDC020472 TaxID=3365075 RepID=UPI00378A3650